MSSRLEQVLSAGLTVAALAIAAAVVRREFFSGPRVSRSATLEQQPQYVADWQAILRHGTRVGPESASVVVLEFGDLECPFCKRFHEGALRPALKRFGPNLAFVYVDFPVPSHRFARAASRAAQCARSQAKFAEYVEITYAKQDSLGLKSWVSYAREAGVSDTAAFQRCVTQLSSVPSTDSGVAVGRRLGVLGTPTILVNGWRFGSPPKDSALFRFIETLLHDKGQETKSPAIEITSQRGRADRGAAAAKR